MDATAKVAITNICQFASSSVNIEDDLESNEGDTDSDVEDVLLLNEFTSTRYIKPKIANYIGKVVINYCADDFKKHFRLHRSTAENIGEDEPANPAIKNSYACPYCTFTGDTYFILKSHMKQHKREKVYKCILNTCGQMFHDLDPFLEHTKSHENEMTYRCHQCNKTFQSLYELGTHQYTHSLYPNRGARVQPRFFRCSHCLNKYATPAALDHHMATSSHSYACPVVSCQKTFPCERYLRRHLHTHGTADVHICKDCGKGFKTEHYLKVHMLTHSGAKPFTCEQCGAAFNRRDKLKRHYLVHEPIKRLKCPFRSIAGCPKEFNRSDKLKAHILTHSNIKPFMCKICERTFTRKSHLRDHERIHNENNNCLYHCRQCGKGFDQEKFLHVHKCANIINVRKRQVDYKFYRPGRPRKLKHSSGVERNSDSRIPRRPGRPRKHIRVTEQKRNADMDELSDNGIPDSADDDIPTAHIEIISTSDNLGTGEITEIALPVTLTNGHFQSILPDNTENLTILPSSPDVNNKFHISNADNVTLHHITSTSLAETETNVMEMHYPRISQIACTVVLPASETTIS